MGRARTQPLVLAWALPGPSWPILWGPLSGLSVLLAWASLSCSLPAVCIVLFFSHIHVCSPPVVRGATAPSRIRPDSPPSAGLTSPHLPAPLLLTSFAAHFVLGVSAIARSN